MDYERKMNMIAYISLILFIIAELVYMVMSNRVTAAFQQGLITQEQMQAQMDKINSYVPYFFVGYVIFIAISTTWLKVAQITYEKEQALRDMLQGPIQLSDSDRYEYLIATQGDSVREVRIDAEILERIEDSEAFNSILESVITDIEGFKIDHARVLKEIDDINNGKKNKKNKENMGGNEGKEKESSETGESEKLIDAFEQDEDGYLDVEAIKRDLQEFFKELSEKLKLDGEHLALYFRIVEDIENLDFPNEEGLFEKSEDRLDDIKAIFYLTIEPDKAFEKRMHPIEPIMIRKKYIDWVLVQFIAKNVPLFIDRSLIITKKQISDKTIEQSRILALTYLMDLTLQKDNELRDEIANLRVELEDKKREISEKWDKIIEKLIDTNELEAKLRSRMTFKPVNLTAILIAILMFIIGILMGIYIVPHPSATIVGGASSAG